mmetsp:Transcript_28604/g.61510  ORF Transcript_28604/g.61510 Transcript_28604/m.61510 type:complete len:219 (+) Transcript_28604:1018-1674(+)
MRHVLKQDAHDVRCATCEVLLAAMIGLRAPEQGVLFVHLVDHLMGRPIAPFVRRSVILRTPEQHDPTDRRRRRRACTWLAFHQNLAVGLGTDVLHAMNRIKWGKVLGQVVHLCATPHKGLGLPEDRVECEHERCICPVEDGERRRREHVERVVKHVLVWRHALARLDGKVPHHLPVVLMQLPAADGRWKQRNQCGTATHIGCLACSLSTRRLSNRLQK